MFYALFQMLTLPDFKEKKLIFITPKEGLEKALKFSNSNICVYDQDELIAKVSLHGILAIMIIGDCTLTTYLINKLTEHGISLYFLDYSLKNKNSINALAEGNYQLREKQYFMANEESLAISKLIVKNKIINQTEILKKSKKIDFRELQESVLAKVNESSDLQQLLAHEGFFSSKYFPIMFEDQNWHRRAPQIKEDSLNAVMDLGYTIAFNYVDSICGLFGFDVYKGFYHQEFFKRKSLVCDLMEPLRPYIDFTLLKAVNLKSFDLEKDFIFRDGQFMFKDFEVRRKYLDVFSKALILKKEDVYLFVLNFYRYLMNPEKYIFKEFLL